MKKNKNMQSKIIFLLLFFIPFFLSVSAQNGNETTNETDIFTMLQEDKNGGNIIINQDSSITNLVLKDIELNSKVKGIPDGFRIQIISVSGRNAREESTQAKEKFLSIYPDFDYQQIYTLYEPPFFKVRVGNYRDKYEALKFYKDILKYFPNAYMVSGQIEYPAVE